ncbi:DUF7260 family protein [Halocalculus aciditolerans]|uniref:DUF7260 domain-containing protein n=1 Tax=Halocalculus aciditolerans TaxID=1383812 RepID=A0A830FNI1_9EURY|nr:hypothetical protein [Halocalculus aciditolerans]GGL73285.1 hypothetical protein GCM10009039_34250 [Halocalculus aciditolerans]
MVVDTYVDDAEARVADERDHVTGERAAFTQFRKTVADMTPRTGTGNGRTGGSAASGGGAAATSFVGDSAGTTQCARVREAFADTVRPYSVDDVDADEPLLVTVREELGESVALALAPNTSLGFTPTVKNALLSTVGDRRQELDAMTHALDRETDSLRDAAADIDDITAWLADVDETPLTALDFDGLRRRHDALADHRATCDRLAADRQTFLRRTTSHNATVGLTHRSLVPYLYQEFSVTYPVLVTVARLDAVLDDCQRAVRRHLTART